MFQETPTYACVGDGKPRHNYPGPHSSFTVPKGHIMAGLVSHSSADAAKLECALNGGRPKAVQLGLRLRGGHGGVTVHGGAHGGGKHHGGAHGGGAHGGGAHGGGAHGGGAHGGGAHGGGAHDGGKHHGGAHGGGKPTAARGARRQMRGAAGQLGGYGY